ncbi:hypothetical protein C5167_041765 [Papaver somniferum]|uniref:uncharacterized protein LOC113327821 n=1 Tax=Papaver somniferum TaxID=3469 RepID=UPI000E70403D|nr:uncharacterized protein LOC113327821 [Papaver somniferum]RZC85584.1 hypothetical protein C5167_041765 [Papaver somniferum]
MASKTSSSFLVGSLFLMLIVLSTFSETASAQKFGKTCRENGGIVERASKLVKGASAIKAEACDECRTLCREKCTEGRFLLEQMFCIRAPCPQPNPLLKIGVCKVISFGIRRIVSCRCCCVDHFIPN